MCEKERWATPCVSLRSHSRYDSKMNLQFYSIRFGRMRKALAPNERACWSEGPISWRSNCVRRHVQFSHLLNEFRISLNICICLWPAAIRAGIIVCKLHKAGDMMFCVIRRGKKKKKHAYIWRDKCISSKPSRVEKYWQTVRLQWQGGGTSLVFWRRGMKMSVSSKSPQTRARWKAPRASRNTIFTRCTREKWKQRHSFTRTSCLSITLKESKCLCFKIFFFFFSINVCICFQQSCMCTVSHRTH